MPCLMIRGADYLVFAPKYDLVHKEEEGEFLLDGLLMELLSDCIRDLSRMGSEEAKVVRHVLTVLIRAVYW